MVSSEEHPESLAAQAAAWVPPWERRREPDREYQAAVEAEAEAVSTHEADPHEADLHEADLHEADPGEADPRAAGSREKDPGAGDRGEVAPVVAIDLPRDLPEEEQPGPTEVEPGPELPLPEPIEEAEALEPDERTADEPVPVDAPAESGTAAQYGAAQNGAAAQNGIVAQNGVAQVPVPAQFRGVREERDATGDNDVRTPSSMDEAELAAALESIMLVVDEPVAEMQLAQVLEQPVERVARVLENVSARYTAAGHGIDLRRAAGGWRLYTRPEYAPYVERFVLDGQSVRLTQAALETLSVVAYKQPVTRSRISAIRGVNCDGVMRTLVTRGLIEECGTEPETGAYLYRTTVLFLEKLGLNSIDQLPPLAPFLPDDVEEVLDASG